MRLSRLWVVFWCGCWIGLLHESCWAQAEAVGQPIQTVISAPNLQPVRPLVAPRQPVAERIRLFAADQPEIPGFKFDNVLLSPSYEQSITYDDNVGGTTTNAQTDYRINYSPGTEIRYAPGPDLFVDADYRFGWHDYTQNLVPNYLTHDADVSASWHPGRGALSARFDGIYQQTANTDVLMQDFVKLSRLQTYELLPSAAYQLCRFSALLNYNYTVTDYFAEKNKTDDSAFQMVTAVLSYKFTERGLAAFVSCAAKFTTTLNPQTGDFKTYETRAGVQGMFKNFQFRFSAGDNLAYGAGTTIHAKSKPGVSLELGYTLNTIVSFQWRADRLLAVWPTTGATINTEFGGLAALRLGRRDQLTLGGSWLREDQASLRRITVRYGAHYRRELTKHFRLAADVDRAEQRGYTGQVVNVDTATIGVTVGF